MPGRVKKVKLTTLKTMQVTVEEVAEMTAAQS
jgi:hypothetical protein